MEQISYPQGSSARGRFAPEMPQASTTRRTGETLVLIVGRDDRDRQALGAVLEQHGFQVFEACDRAAMIFILQSHRMDMIILNDRPFYDGLALCRELATVGAPIVMLADCEDVTDRIVAMEVGADEVMARPFDIRELVARVRCLLRRSCAVTRAAGPRIIEFSGWRLDEETRVLMSPTGLSLQLSASEYSLLKVFLNAPKTVVDATAASAALGVDLESCKTNFRTSVCRLRRKLGRDRAGSSLLRTVYGRGYVLEVGDALVA